VSLEDLRDEDGFVDTAKVEAAFDELEQTKPHWRRIDPRPDLHQGVPETVAPSARRSFGESFKRALNEGE
jgi:hypothetical protein